MITDAKYFVFADGKQFGPFSGQQIRTKLFRRTITLQDYIWREGIDDEWLMVGSIRDELPPAAAPRRRQTFPSYVGSKSSITMAQQALLLTCQKRAFTNQLRR